MVRIDKEPLEDKVNSNQIKTRFKTSWAKALIFLAAFNVCINFYSIHQNKDFRVYLQIFILKIHSNFQLIVLEVL
jgi:hypothetical protein